MARYGWRLTSGKATLEVRFNDTLRFSTNATGIGFFTAAPVAQPTAYTQTYATANKTVAAATAIAGSSSAGANGYSSAAEAAAIQTAINALVADDLDNRQTLNALIDDLQALGLVL